MLDAILKLKDEEGYKGMNWESKRNEYELIMELILKQYSRDGNRSCHERKSCCKTEKNGTKFQEAVDPCGKSGGRRVVLYVKTWGSSPAVTTMVNSVGSSVYNGNLQNQGELEGENSTVLDGSSFNSSTTRNSDSFHFDRRTIMEILVIWILWMSRCLLNYHARTEKSLHSFSKMGKRKN